MRLKTKNNSTIVNLLQHLQRKNRTDAASKGQSFVELALIIPILLVMLLGVVEVAFFLGRYLDILDLTREAARFASVRDPFETTNSDFNCSTPNLFDFYYDTACIFSPPATSDMCTDLSFCNGMNPYVSLDETMDDVVISVYTITNNSVSNIWPSGGYWALSDHDADGANNGNWQTDCEGNIVRSEPYYTSAMINSTLAESSSGPANKGYVAVEFYYCYEQALNIPILSEFVPNPMRIHAYTLMPLPASQPSATPKP